MTCKVCCNLTHLIDRPHMKTCPRWIEGGGVSIYIYIDLCVYVNTYTVACMFAYMQIIYIHMYVYKNVSKNHNGHSNNKNNTTLAIVKILTVVTTTITKTLPIVLTTSLQ